MAGLKQVVISMVIVLIAALILVGMVGYTVILLRTAQFRILTGETVAYGRMEAACVLQAAFPYKTKVTNEPTMVSFGMTTGLIP